MPFRAHLAPLALIALAAALLFATTPTAGDFWWNDSSRHAMNGIFLRDLLAQGGWLHPVEFARAYYARYPAINIGFYPPLFYVLTAPFLLIFGVSHAATQAVVALHAAAAGILSYLLLAPRLGRAGAAGAALVVLFIPDMALWSRQVQLDVPAIAWLLAFAWALVRYRRGGRTGWMFAAAVLAGMAVLVRVQLVFVLPVFALGLLVRPPCGQPRPALRLAAFATAVLLALPATAMLLLFSRQTGALAGAMPGMPALWSLDNWTWYARAVPAQTGWPVLAAVGAGLAVLAARLRRPNPPNPLRAGNEDLAVLALLLAAAWLFFTVVSNKEARFNLPGVVLLVLLGLGGLGALHRRAAAVVCLGLGLAAGAQALGTQVPRVGGFAEAARAALAASPEGSNIFVSAWRDGSLIYNGRVQGGSRDVGFRRADKVLVEVNIMSQLGVEDKGLDDEQLLALLRRERIAVLVVQPGYLSDQPTMARFERLLADPARFEVLRRVPITGQVWRPDEKELVVYRLRQPTTPPAEPAPAPG